MKNYLDEYKANGYDRIYNGLNLPRHGKGSGCSAFGVSFLELINAFDFIDNKSWLIDQPIPNKLIGSAEEGRKVRLLKVIFSFKWAKEEESHRHIVLYDPWKMKEWVLESFNYTTNEMFTSKEIGTVKGLVFPCLLECKPHLPVFYSQ